MASTDQVSKRRQAAILELLELPGAIRDESCFKDHENPTADPLVVANRLSDPKFLTGLQTVGKFDRLGGLLENTELLEFLARVLPSIIQRIEALESELATNNRGRNKSNNAK